MQDQNSRPPRGRDNESISLVIPAGLGETLNQQLLELGETIAESFGGEIAATRADSARRDKPGREGARLRAVEALHDQLAWDERRPDETIALAGERWLLRSVIHGSVVWVADRIAYECHRPCGDGLNVEGIQAQQEQLVALLDLWRLATDVPPA